MTWSPRRGGEAQDAERRIQVTREVGGAEGLRPAGDLKVRPRRMQGKNGLGGGSRGTRPACALRALSCKVRLLACRPLRYLCGWVEPNELQLPAFSRAERSRRRTDVGAFESWRATSSLLTSCTNGRLTS